MKRLDHVAVAVSNLEAALYFYEQLLGLRLQFQERDEAHGEAFAFLELEGGNLELLQGLDATGAPAPFVRPVIREPYCPHIAIATEDLDALVQDLDAKGVARIQGPLEIPGSVRWVYYADPDNNVLEFVQWTKAKLG